MKGNISAEESIRKTFYETFPMPGPWTEFAACKGLDVNWFFPKTNAERKLYQPDSICAECPVQTQCLEFAMAVPMARGIWGGTAHRDRLNKRVRGVMT